MDDVNCRRSIWPCKLGRILQRLVHRASDADAVNQTDQPWIGGSGLTRISVLSAPGRSRTFARSNQVPLTSIEFASPGTSLTKPLDVIEGVMR